METAKRNSSRVLPQKIPLPAPFSQSWPLIVDRVVNITPVRIDRDPNSGGANGKKNDPRASHENVLQFPMSFDLGRISRIGPSSKTPNQVAGALPPPPLHLAGALRLAAAATWTTAPSSPASTPPLYFAAASWIYPILLLGKGNICLSISSAAFTVVSASCFRSK